MTIDLSGTYFIREIFHIGGVHGSYDGRSEFLNWDNCKVENKTLLKDKDKVVLHLKREKDDEQGKVAVTLKPEFSNRVDLLTNFFVNKEVMRHTLNELKNFKITVQ